MKPSSISRRLVVDKLQGADDQLNELWKTIAALRGPKMDKTHLEGVRTFQLKLFDTLCDIEDLYRVIINVEKSLISRKATLSDGWFKKRMKLLAQYRRCARDLADLGRRLGDAFAWFFYERDRELIEKHEEKQHQPFLPIRVGRAGERSIIEGMQTFDGYLLLHHGITNFLRIGDFSIIELQSMRCIGLVEAKTHRISKNQISVNLNFLAGKKIDFPSISGQSDKNALESHQPLSNEFFSDVLDRQIREMKIAISSEKYENEIEKIKLETENHYKTISILLARCPKSQSVFSYTGDGVMFGAIPLPRTGRFDPNVSLTDSQLSKRIDKFPERAKSLFLKNRTDNSLIIRTLNKYYDKINSIDIPLQWWPIDSSLIRKVLFNEIMLISAHNPAFFHRELENLGFNVETNAEGKLVQAIRTSGDHEVKLENFDHFCEGLAKGSMSLSSIRRLVEKAIHTLKDKGSGPGRLEIRTVHHRHEP